MIPIISWFSFCAFPYVYSENEVALGYLRHKNGGYVFGSIRNDSYEIWKHTTPNTSIYCNGKQVGLIIEQRSKRMRGDKYKVIYNKSLSKELAAIICLLSDILWHNSTVDNTIQIGGKKFDSSWLPEE